MWITAENAFLFLKVKKDDKLSVYLRSPSDVDERNNAVLQPIQNETALYSVQRRCRCKHSAVQQKSAVQRCAAERRNLKEPKSEFRKANDPLIRKLFSP